MRKRTLCCVLLALMIAMMPAAALAEEGVYTFNGATSDRIHGDLALVIDPCSRICVAASGQRIVFNAFWTNETYIDIQKVDPINNSDITYLWTVSDNSILTNLQPTDLMEIDLPDMIGIHGREQSFEGSRVVGTCAEPGHVDVYCTGFANDESLPVGDYTGMMVLALNASPVPNGRLGDTFQLQSYWCTDRSQTYQEAKDEIPNGIGPQYGGFWNGLEDEWRIMSFTNSDGQVFIGKDAAEAAGAIHRLSSIENDGETYGNLSSVTPKKAGTYVFECLPSVGNVPAQVTVKVESNDTASATRPPSADDPVPGDYNNDGRVTMTDIVQMAKVLRNLLTPDDAALSAADLNHNGRIDLSDLVQVAKILSGEATQVR